MFKEIVDTTIKRDTAIKSEDPIRAKVVEAVLEYSYGATISEILSTVNEAINLRNEDMAQAIEEADKVWKEMNNHE